MDAFEVVAVATGLLAKAARSWASRSWVEALLSEQDTVWKRQRMLIPHRLAILKSRFSIKNPLKEEKYLCPNSSIPELEGGGVDLQIPLTYTFRLLYCMGKGKQV